MILGLRAAFREIHSHHSAAQAARELRATGPSESIPGARELIEFIEVSRCGILRSRPAPRGC